MSVTWLHISDFHFRAGDPYEREVVLLALVESVERFCREGRKPDLIFATGDVAYSGKPQEYQLATRFFDDLLKAAGLKKKYLFIVPGNHDVDRTRCIGLARTLATREEADDYFGQDYSLDHLTKVQAGFLDWHNEYFKDVPRLMTQQSTCGPVVEIEVRGSKIGILPINTALFCRDDSDHDKLWVGRRCLNPAIKELTSKKADLTVALMHHPLEWLNTVERSNIKAKLQKNVDFVLRGHVHENEVEAVASVHGSTLHMGAGAAYDSQRWPNSVLYCTIEGNSARVFPIRYEDKPDEVWTTDPSIFPYEPAHQKSFLIPRLAAPATLPAPAARQDFLFGRDEFSDDWFSSQVHSSIADLGNRYTAELNVQLDLAKCFDGLARNVVFRDLSSRHFDDFFRALNKVISSLSKYDLLQDAVKEIENERLSLENRYVETQNLELGHIDIDEMVRANKQISKLLYKCEDAIGQDSNQKKTLESSHAYLLNRIYQALAEVRKFEEFSEGSTLAASNNPVLLLIGEAGVGKSHLLADVAKRNIDSAQPCVFLLGQHFTSEEPPWTQILHNLLRINCSERELLGALNARAQAQGCRILFIIDAINEGKGRYFWPDHILSFIRLFSEYEWLSLVLSIRTSYANLLAPEDLISKDIAIRVQHHGFRDIEYEATSFFFQQYGIEQPSVPLLHPEFSNPLLLKLFCDGLKRAGLCRIPKGYTGITRIFEFFLMNVNKKLCRPSEFDYPEGANIVRKVIDRLIKAKLQRNVSFIGYEEAYAIADQEMQKFSQKKRFLDALLSEGVLSKNLFWEYKDTYEEGVYLAYERFEDHLTAAFLLDNYLKEDDPKKAFQKRGKLRGHVDQYYYHQNLMESFSIQLPERIGKDLYELLPKELASRNPVADAFIQSLIWRQPETITEKTHKYINERILPYKSTYDSFFEMVYSVALDPKHPFNAQGLHHYLMRFSLADRDAVWTIYLHDKDEKGTAIRRLIDWALSDREKSYLSKKSRLLAGKALAWLLPSTNIALRDMATKALVDLFEGNIPLLKSLIEAFAEVNDPYIYERIFAAAYGVVLRSNSLNGLRELSSSILERIFLKETVYPNILVRDYARNIIEYAIYKDEFKLDDPSAIRPPYRSSFPNSFPTNEEIDRDYKFDYESQDFKKYYWSQNHIIDSMATEYGRAGFYGDFGRYTFQSRLSGWDKFNPQDLSNYACKLIFDKFGYDIEKHGKFDLNAAVGTRGRNEKERIGKKYQWIALYEILARISDNHKMTEESSRWGKRKKYIWYQGPWEPFVRNIDPTLAPIRLFALDQKSELAGTYSWLHVNYDFGEEDSADWAASRDGLPEPKDLMMATDYKDENWLVLETNPSWEEPVPLGEEIHEFPHKRLWYQVRSYLLKEKAADKVMSWMQKKYVLGSEFGGRRL